MFIPYWRANMNGHIMATTISNNYALQHKVETRTNFTVHMHVISVYFYCAATTVPVPIIPSSWFLMSSYGHKNN